MRPFCQRIRPYRSLRVYIKTYVAAVTTTAVDIHPETNRDWSSALLRIYCARGREGEGALNKYFFLCARRPLIGSAQ